MLEVGKLYIEVVLFMGAGQGVIPEASQKILRTVGKWLQVNGEAIYETNHTPFFYPDITWKCTTKPGKIYFHIVNWPGTKLEISGLENRVTNAYFLANKEKIEFEQKGNNLLFTLPTKPIDPYNTVILVEIEEMQVKVTPGYGYRDSQKEVTFYARDARIRGEEARYDWGSQSVSGFVNSGSPKNELRWYHFPYEDGEYHIDIEYACDDSIAGSEFYFYNRMEEEHRYVGTIQGTGGQFKTFRLMNVNMTKEEDNRLVFGLVENDKSANVRVRRIILGKEPLKDI